MIVLPIEFGLWAGFVQYICAPYHMVNISDNGKLYCSSFTWFPLGIRVGGNINSELFACQNCENRMFIDHIVLEKNWVAVTTDLGELSIHWQEVQLPIYVPEIKLLRYYFV